MFSGILLGNGVEPTNGSPLRKVVKWNEKNLKPFTAEDIRTKHKLERKMKPFRKKYYHFYKYTTSRHFPEFGIFLYREQVSH